MIGNLGSSTGKLSLEIENVIKAVEADVKDSVLY